MAEQAGANWEILIDGKPRSYRDDHAIALEAALYLQSKNAGSKVQVRNFTTGEIEAIPSAQPSVAWAAKRKAKR
jgi:hypothetical protein